MARTNKIIRMHDDNQLLAGLLAREAKSVLPLDGQDMKAKDIVPKLKARIAALNKSALKKAEWQAALAEEQALMEASDAFVSMVRQALKLKYKNQPDVLAEFGLSPPKQRRALTAEETNDKVARIRATRKARHTMGPRKRLEIRGTPDAAKAASATPAADAPVTTTPSASQPASTTPSAVNGASH